MVTDAYPTRLANSAWVMSSALRCRRSHWPNDTSAELPSAPFRFNSGPNLSVSVSAAVHGDWSLWRELISHRDDITVLGAYLGAVRSHRGRIRRRRWLQHSPVRQRLDGRRPGECCS